MDEWVSEWMKLVNIQFFSAWSAGKTLVQSCCFPPSSSWFPKEIICFVFSVVILCPIHFLLWVLLILISPLVLWEATHKQGTAVTCVAEAQSFDEISCPSFYNWLRQAGRPPSGRGFGQYNSSFLQRLLAQKNEVCLPWSLYLIYLKWYLQFIISTVSTDTLPRIGSKIIHKTGGRPRPEYFKINYTLIILHYFNWRSYFSHIKNSLLLE